VTARPPADVRRRRRRCRAVVGGHRRRRRRLFALRLAEFSRFFLSVTSG